MNVDTPKRPPPRYELWNLRLPAAVKTLRFAQFGAQAASAERAAQELERFRPVLDRDDGPDELSRGSFVDAAGLTNAVFMAYWFNPQNYARWAGSAAVQDAWDALPEDGDAGYWREIVQVPSRAVDTLYTPHDPAAYGQTGVAQHGTMQVCPAHDYWGAARDRLPGLSEEELRPELERILPNAAETRGRRVSAAVPANVCMARHHEDWRQSPVSGPVYRREVAPVKEAGIAHLAAHFDLGCIAARAIRGEDLDGRPIQRADAIAWFASLGHLLDWARSDRSHLAIYGAFFKAAAAMAPGQKWDVPMWHEVFVVPRGAAQADYVNCHNRTGFLALGAGGS